MFPNSWFPGSYWPASYWPKTGGVPPTPPPVIPGGQTPLYIFDMQQPLLGTEQIIAFPDYVFTSQELFAPLPRHFLVSGGSQAQRLAAEGNPGTSEREEEFNTVVPGTVLESSDEEQVVSTRRIFVVGGGGTLKTTAEGKIGNN